MSGSREQSLYFISLPDQKKLCLVTLSLQVSPEDCRNQQIKTCRDLVLVYSDILASPALNTFTDIWLIMTMAFYTKGIIQAYGHRHNLQLGAPQCVLPGILQCCVSYSLTTRLAPCWNRAGPYLLSGKDFLAESGRLNAIRMELNARENQLCVSVQANAVRLAPTKLEDFDFPPMVLKSFFSQMDCVLHVGASSWCYVLPSMKRGRIMSISHHLPTDSPFKTYQDLQKHWQSLYGYSLPEQTTEEQIYCSVYFKPIGERLFTYPLSCVRLQPMHCCPRVNLQGALNSFISDLRDRLQSICGLPVPMTGKPCYHTSSLTSSGSAQVLDGELVNLSTRSSVRPVLAQLPSPAAPPVRPPVGLRPPGRPPAPLQPGGAVSQGQPREDVRAAQERQGGPHRANDTRTQSPFGERARPPSASAATAPSCSPSARPSPVSSLPAATPLPSPAPVNPPLKLVPIFRNRSLARHVNVIQLLAQKQQRGQRRGGAAEGGRVTLATHAGKRAAPAASSSPSPSDPCLASSSSSSSSSSLPSSLFVRSHRPCDPIVPPSFVLPRFTHHSKSAEVNALQWSHNHHRPKASHAAATVPRHQPNPEMTLGASQRGVAKSGCESQPLSSILKPAAPAVPVDVPSNKGGERFESTPKRRRPNIQEVDVEGMARNNQLSKVNSATLLAWLRGRGVPVRVKDKKEELMLWVMGCLAEA